jgi:hypothetical protein
MSALPYARWPEAAKEAHRAAMRRNWARGYTKARQAGMCTRGCGGPADPGMASCAVCRQARKERLALMGVA